MFNDRLRFLRKQSGMSMDEFAKLYNEKFDGKLNKSTISRYENGLQQPMVSVAKNIAEMFSVSADFLLSHELTLGDRIKIKREELGISQKQLATSTGIPQETIEKYELGFINTLREKELYDIAGELKTTIYYLMGQDRTSYRFENDKIIPRNTVHVGPRYEDLIQARKSSVKIPILGAVQAGYPVFADEEVLDYEEIDTAMAASGEYFALYIRGNSMEPKFSEGDVVIIRKQSTVDNGEIGVFLVNGDDATIKKFSQSKDGIMLIATNPSYDPLFYSNTEIEELPVLCLGKVVELRAKF